MIKSSTILILTLASLGLRECHSQINRGNYIIVTFESKYERSLHNETTFYWIISEDSLKAGLSGDKLAHLFIEGFSSNNLNSCCQGKEFDPFVLTTNTSFTFDSIYFESIDKLKALLFKERKMLQRTIITWSSGQVKEISIYATAVTGEFCFSNFDKIGYMRYGYSGKVSIPVSSFDSKNDFWKSERAKFVLNSDFSKFRYDVLPY